MWRRDSLSSAGSNTKAKASNLSMPNYNTMIFSTAQNAEETRDIPKGKVFWPITAD